MADGYWARYSNIRRSRRAFLGSSAIAALGSAALLAGCGDDDSGSKTATSAPSAKPGSPSTGSSTATGVPNAVRGGTFRTSTGDPFRGGDPQINTLEPILHTPRSYSWTHRYMVSENKMILDMATKFEQPDPTTLIVHIRPDIKFHNVAPMNGRLLTSSDLMYTYQRLPAVKAKGSSINPTAYTWMDLPALQAPDATTLTIKQTRPFADNLIYMGQHFFAVVAKEAAEAAGGDLTKVNSAGSGPYILSPQSDPSTKLTWNRNPDYFSHDHSDQFWFPQGGGYPDAYEQRVLPDSSATQAQLISGDLDQLYYLLLNVDKAIAADFQAKGLQVQQAQANTNCQMQMAIDKFPDTRVRQAIQKAIDYDAIIKTVYLGDGELSAPVGNGFPDTVRLPRAQLANYLKYDPAAAKQLWNAAAPTKTEFTLLSIPNQPFAVQMTSAIKESLEKTLPVKVNIQGVDVPTWLAKALQKPADKDWDFLVSYGESLAAVPGGNILGTFEAQDQPNSGSGFSVVTTTPGLIDLAKQARALSDAHYADTNPQTRQEKLYAFQKFVLENAIPAFPLAVRKYDWLVASKRLKNIPVKNDNFFRSYLVDNWYLDPNKP